MNNKKMMNYLLTTVEIIAIVLLTVDMVLQVLTFEITLTNVILCACALMLIPITLIFDEILKDNKSFTLHLICYAILFINLIKTIYLS